MKTRDYLEAVCRSASLILGKIATMSDAEIDDYVDENEAFSLKCHLSWIEEDMP
jgi:hypothetical protein